MSKRTSKTLALILALLLIFQQSGFAQVAAELNIAGHLSVLRNSFVVDKFRPLHLRYLQYLPENNSFKLFLDKGDLKDPRTQELENTSKDLMKYFFIGLALPNDSFWVNLRPDAEDNIIDEYLSKTDIGKIMLETDLQLKKDTALFTSPQTPEGKVYWNKLYKKAEELYGSENITIPTLTRPWIVPGEIIIRETTDSAYIYKATLKVMLEQDYLKDSATYNFQDTRAKALNEYSSQLIRELIIPKLTKEVNTSKRYAPLRQVYYSLILAQWFKARHKGLANLINSKDLTNLISKDPWSKTTYFQAYQKSFKDGEYNIKESTYTPSGQSIRSYFSGGENFNNITSSSIVIIPARTVPSAIKKLIEAPSASSPVGADSDATFIESIIIQKLSSYLSEKQRILKLPPEIAIKYFSKTNFSPELIKRRLQELTRLTVSSREKQVSLHIANGSSLLPLADALAGYKVIATDLSEGNMNRVEEAQKILQHTITTNKGSLEFKELNILRITKDPVFKGYGENSIDHITITDLLGFPDTPEFLPHVIDGIFEEIIKVLRPGGTLTFSSDLEETITMLKKKLSKTGKVTLSDSTKVGQGGSGHTFYVLHVSKKDNMSDSIRNTESNASSAVGDNPAAGSAEQEKGSLLTAYNPVIKDRVVHSDEVRKRYDSVKTPEKNILIGFMRDNDGKIQPVFSNSPRFKSIREKKADSTWNPERIIQNIPVRIEKVKIKKARKTPDWDRIPPEIQEIFNNGILITSDTQTQGPYSVLMAVTPPSGGNRAEGRTGILLKDGLPIIVEINGKEFVLEIKGIGAPEGGYDYNYAFLRGGAQKEEIGREYANLEAKRNLNNRYNDDNAVRAIVGIEFDRGQGTQGYLLRLAPGSIRATYSENLAFATDVPKEHSRRISYAMGKQMGAFYSQGLMPYSHPENLIVLNKGADFIFTDYSDIMPIHIFPTDIEDSYFTFFEVIRDSLNSSTEIPGYDAAASFKAFLQGLADGLEESGKITAENKNELLRSVNFDQIRNFLWEHFFAVDYYLARKNHGWTPHFFQYLQASVDVKFLDQLVERARKKHSDNARRILETKKIFGEGGNRREIERLERENYLLEQTGFSVEGIIALTDSDTARSSLVSAIKGNVGLGLYGIEHYVIWNLWNENFDDLRRVIKHLKEEQEFLKTVSKLTEGKLKTEVEENLQIATARIEVIQNMTPHEYYLDILKDRNFAKRMAILPYFSKNTKALSSLGANPTAGSPIDIQKGEYSIDDLWKEGYRVSIEKRPYPWSAGPLLRVRVFKDDKEITGEDGVYLLPIHKYRTVIIDKFYPNFPDEKIGRGRALLRHLLLRPEYAGYYVIAKARPEFQKSFMKMDEFQPMADMEGKTIYERIGKGKHAEYLSVVLGGTGFRKESGLEQILGSEWEDTTICGIVPVVSASSALAASPAAGSAINLNPEIKTRIVELFTKLKEINYGSYEEADRAIGEVYFKHFLISDELYSLPKPVTADPKDIGTILNVVLGSSKPACAVDLTTEKVLREFVKKYPNDYGLERKELFNPVLNLKFNCVVFYNKKAIELILPYIQRLGVKTDNVEQAVKLLLKNNNDKDGILYGIPYDDVIGYIEPKQRPYRRSRSISTKFQTWNTYSGNEEVAKEARERLSHDEEIIIKITGLRIPSAGSPLYSTQGLKSSIPQIKEADALRFRPQAPGEKSGSPINKIGEEVGGIDFRALPIVTQAMSNLKPLFRDGLGQSLKINLGKERQEIERMSSSGITPSPERIKEYLQASCAKGDILEDKDKIILCIADILRSEEESCCITDPTLRDILVVLEFSGSSAELNRIFLG